MSNKQHDDNDNDDGNPRNQNQLGDGDDEDENEDDSEPEASDDDHNEDDDRKDDPEHDEKERKKEKKKVHRLSLTETEDFNAKLRKRGVVYVARIPPKMTPTKIKRLLSDFGGEVTRVYLVEEDPAKRKRRKKELGSSGGKRYVEGWVEFAKKRVAKHVAMSLNTTPISNHKRDPHFGDLWALKYLPKFSWSHLTEKVAYERRVREQKLRIEMMQARRENAQYVEMVETGKKLDKIEERLRNNENSRSNDQQKQKRPLGGVGDDNNNDSNSNDKTDVGSNKKRRRNKHHQLQPVRDGGEKPANLALLKTLI